MGSVANPLRVLPACPCEVGPAGAAVPLALAGAWLGNLQWYGRADITALEPSSVPFSDGLLAAIDRGDAWIIGPGEERSVEVSVSLIPVHEEKGNAA